MIDSRKQTVDAYNKHAKEYAKYFDSRGPETDIIELIFNRLIKIKNPKVFEIGCANGRDAKEIIKHTDDYLGIDISKNLLQIAKVNLPDTKFEVADVLTYEFSNNIDVIFANSSLLHLDKAEIRQVLEKASVSQNPNGLFYISLKRFKEYKAFVKEGDFGSRQFYGYKLELVEQLSKDFYEIIYKDQNVQDNLDWLELVLKRR